GDVGVLELGDVRDHRPVAGQVCPGDLLDPGQLARLDGTELAEVDLRPRQQVQPAATATGAGGRGAFAGHHALDELLHVLAGDAAGARTALHLAQVDPELAREQPHRGARVGNPVREQLVGVEGDRRRAARGRVGTGIGVAGAVGRLFAPGEVVGFAD